MSSSLRNERLLEFRESLSNQLKNAEMQEKIRNLVLESQLDLGSQNEPPDEQQLLFRLKKSGIIDKVISQLGFTENGYISTENTVINSDGKQFLCLELCGGRAFVDSLVDETPNNTFDDRPTLCVHLYFQNQRFASKPIDSVCEPNFTGSFFFELSSSLNNYEPISLDSKLFSILSEPIHMVMIKSTSKYGNTVLSSHYLDWKPILSNANNVFDSSIQLIGTQVDKKITVGILNVHMELVPRLSKPFDSSIISTQLQLNQSKKEERTRLFLIYAKEWWQEFKQIRESHASRLVKIFAQDENGVSKPVFTFIQPYRTGRLIETPYYAARFVSLIPYEPTPTIGSNDKKEQWSSMHLFLSCKKGDTEDHCVLLCSMLLGFGLDAYVCVGTLIDSSPTTWVLTIDQTVDKVTFWNSISGERIVHKWGPSVLSKENQPNNLPYDTVDCLFNHESLYANCQLSSDISCCSFNLHDHSKWKPLSREAISALCHREHPFPILRPPTIDWISRSNDLEIRVRSLLKQHRDDCDLLTLWNDDLSFYLSPALLAYEMERTFGSCFSNEEFQQTIRKKIPDGYIFKGFPIQFLHCNPRRMFVACLKSEVCQEIIQCRGDNVKFAVRVRVFPYPEDVCATWLMVACSYRPSA